LFTKGPQKKTRGRERAYKKSLDKDRTKIQRKKGEPRENSKGAQTDKEIRRTFVKAK